MANPGASNPILPEVPLDFDPTLTAYLMEQREKLNQLFITFNIPGIVTGATATANSSATVLRWNATSQASMYRIYRNSTGDFSTASVIGNVAASKTGVASLSYQDSQDQDTPTRYYWIQGVNERGFAGVQSAMLTITNFFNPLGATALGVNADASGTNSTALGYFAVAGDNSTAVGGQTEANILSTAVGFLTRASGSRSIAIGSFCEVESDNSIVIGAASTSIAAHFGSVAIGTFAATTASNQFTAGSATFPFTDFQVKCGTNGQAWSIQSLSELVTIAAAATTVTTIPLPTNTTIKAVTVTTVVAIPTAATYTVTGDTSGTVFSTAPVSTAALASDKGNANCPYANGVAQFIRITPNLTPAANTGRVRVTVIYEDVTPATS